MSDSSSQPEIEAIGTPTNIMDSKELESKILVVLEQTTPQNPMKTLDIARTIFGPGSQRKMVNSELYRLSNRKKVVKIAESDGTNPRWYLASNASINSQVFPQSLPTSTYNQFPPIPNQPTQHVFTQQNFTQPAFIQQKPTLVLSSSFTSASTSSTNQGANQQNPLLPPPASTFMSKSELRSMTDRHNRNIV